MTSFEDTIAAFQLEAAPARGRYADLGAATLDPILRRHDYPRPVALLLGEAMTLASLIGALFKVEGRLSLQAEGSGLVPLLVADYAMDGGLRGYARLKPGAEEALAHAHALSPVALLGEGALLTITLDQGPDAPLMQGIVPLEGATLAACAERYFERSEQTPTRIRVAVGEALTPGAPSRWRAGGALLQRIAGDVARPLDEDAWETAEALFATVSDHELIDPDLGPERLLFRLFHELGPRLSAPAAIEDRCGCDGARVSALLARYTAEEVRDFVEPDGKIHARCQFCSRLYLLEPADL